MATLLADELKTVHVDARVRILYDPVRGISVLEDRRTGESFAWWGNWKDLTVRHAKRYNAPTPRLAHFKAINRLTT